MLGGGQAGVRAVREGRLILQRRLGAVRFGVLRSSLVRRCLGDSWERPGFLVRGAGARAPGSKPAAARRSGPALETLWPRRSGARALSRSVGRWRAVEGRDVNISVSSPQFENSKGRFSLSGSRKLYFDTHAFVCFLEKNGFTTQQAEIIVSDLMNIMKGNMDVIYKDMVTKIQQEIALQRIMSHIGVVKKDMIILEKSEFSALRAENEKLKLQLQQLKKQVLDESSKVRTDNKLDFNLEKSRVKESCSLNERKLLKMRTEIVELHAQQDRALTQTDKKIDTEVAGLKTMLESHKLDNIKYLAGSVFTCLTVALGFYRIWM